MLKGSSLQFALDVRQAHVLTSKLLQQDTVCATCILDLTGTLCSNVVFVFIRRHVDVH